ncbi:MAG: hypothetical protein K4H23_04915 [Mollicutes bacterium PWAP]|nr:hypothetical protein [Mollicutes bacterium PWAP]
MPINKIRVLIDFEAISNPFSRKLKIDLDLPFAYSMSFKYKGNWNTKSYVIDFNKVGKYDVYSNIRKSIIKNLKQILGYSFKVNSETIYFVGWAPILERKLVTKIFNDNFDVKDLAKGHQISLSKVTRELDKNYWEDFSKAISRNIDNEIASKRAVDSNDGAKAALAGYILFCKANGIKDKKWYFNFDSSTLLKELYEYSKDDVIRMIMIEENYSSFLEKTLLIEKERHKKNKIRSKISNLTKANNIIDEFDLMTRQLEDGIQTKIIDLEKKLKDLD